MGRINGSTYQPNAVRFDYLYHNRKQCHFGRTNSQPSDSISNRTRRLFNWFGCSMTVQSLAHLASTAGNASSLLLEYIGSTFGVRWEYVASTLRVHYRRLYCHRKQTAMLLIWRISSGYSLRRFRQCTDVADGSTGRIATYRIQYKLSRVYTAVYTTVYTMRICSAYRLGQSNEQAHKYPASI